jgi:sec-independent protein translocase protein TatA
MFKNFGPLELGIILVIVLLIFGAGKLPQIGGAVGKSIREFKSQKNGTDERPVQNPSVTASKAEDKNNA